MCRASRVADPIDAPVQARTTRVSSVRGSMVAMSARWLLVVGKDGELLAAHGGAPTAWIGELADAWKDAPPSLRTAVHALVDEMRHSPSITTRAVDVRDGDTTIQLVGIEAMALRRARIDLRALLAHCMATLERQARALDVDLRIEVDDAVPELVLLDPEKIGWAVTSLVGNSLRHVKHGTRQMPGGSIGVRTRWDAQRRELVVAVADDGPGIPPAIQERLFRRAPGASQATGLALTVVRDVVAAHGGTMDVETSTDAETHGTTVTFRVPQP